MFGGAGTVVLSPSKQFHVKSKRCKKGSRRNKKTGLCVKHSGSLGQSQPKRKSPKRRSPKRKSPKRRSPKRKSIQVYLSVVFVVNLTVNKIRNHLAEVLILAQVIIAV